MWRLACAWRLVEEGAMVVAVLLGSVRSERMGGRAAKWVVSQLEKRRHEAVLVDAAALELPILDKMWKEVGPKQGAHAPAGYGELKKKLAPLAELYARADGFCVVSAEYNHSAPPGLTNLIDYFLEEYFWRPSAIVCYSATPFGGVRAAMQLRALLAETGMPSIPSIQPIPSVATALTEDGVALTQELAEKSGKFFDEFEWYMRAYKTERAKGVPY
jgi:NAD(P)H-dependent FMN reductase